jgi:NAD(P)-dependent dehydrogenase (short-subunit alcohol dehydrogenase family)
LLEVCHPHIKASGGGAIVNIASVHSYQNVGGTAPYAASKGGVVTLTRVMAIDHGKDKIRVNAICPGWIYTPLIQGIFAGDADPAKAKQAVERRQLLGRLGNPEEVGQAAAFLASDEASYITGASLMVDNGMTALLGRGSRGGTRGASEMKIGHLRFKFGARATVAFYRGSG